MTPRTNLPFLIAVLVLCPLSADEPPKTPEQFGGLEYRSIGPSTGGRTTRAVGVPGDPMTYYVATAGGGVWKSTDGGINFKPIFDDLNGSVSYDDIRICLACLRNDAG